MTDTFFTAIIAAMVTACVVAIGVLIFESFFRPNYATQILQWIENDPDGFIQAVKETLQEEQPEVEPLIKALERSETFPQKLLETQ